MPGTLSRGRRGAIESSLPLPEPWASERRGRGSPTRGTSPRWGAITEHSANQAWATVGRQSKRRLYGVPATLGNPSGLRR